MDNPVLPKDLVDKKLTWQELLTNLKKKVSEGEAAQKNLDIAIGNARAAQEKYNTIAAEIDTLKTSLQSTIGNIFTTESRVRQY